MDSVLNQFFVNFLLKNKQTLVEFCFDVHKFFFDITNQNKLTSNCRCEKFDGNKTLA